MGPPLLSPVPVDREVEGSVHNSHYHQQKHFLVRVVTKGPLLAPAPTTNGVTFV